MMEGLGEPGLGQSMAQYAQTALFQEWNSGICCYDIQVLVYSLYLH
jgi:hypothetical protein